MRIDDKVWLRIAVGGAGTASSLSNASMQTGQFLSDARVAKANAGILDAQAQQIGAAGARNEDQVRREYRRFAGSQAAELSEGSLGLEGSALDVIQDSEAQAYLDALNVRYGAQSEAVAVRNSARMQRYQSTLARKMAGRAREAGYVNAIGAIAGAAGAGR